MKNYEIVIGDDTIELADELTLGQYQEITKSPERYKNPIQLISLFTGISVMELKNQDVETIEMLEAVIGTRFKIPDINEMVLTFNYDGVDYGLEMDWSKLAFGAWVDFEVYSAENIYDNLHRIMAILYRPIQSWGKNGKYTIKPYRSEEIEERAEIMKLVPVKYWLSSAVFFLALVKIYTTNIENSLTSTMNQYKKAMKGIQKLPQPVQKILLRGFTSPLFTSSQKKTLQNLTK